MTTDQHKRIRINLLCRIARLTTRLKGQLSLADKLVLMGERREVERELREHKLNYFVLVTE